MPPAVALLGRRLRGRLDALRPDLAATARSAQQRQLANKSGTLRDIAVGDTVLARDYTAKGEKWTEGTVSSQTGPVSYKVDVAGAKSQWRRHQDQLIQVGPKNRYSLSRTSTALSDPDNLPELENDKSADDGADDTFKDASDSPSSPSVGVPGSPGPAGYRGPVAAGTPCPPTPPPPNATSRTIRAYKRANAKLI